MLKNTAGSYGSVNKFLHWTIGLLIIGMLVFGYFLSDFANHEVYNIHKLIGLTILLLVLIRIIWVSTNGRPKLTEPMPKWERILAYSTEGLLYICMVLMPVFGWLGTSYYGYAPMLFGHSLGLPVIPNQHYASFFMGLHGDVAIILIALISLHVLGALKHFVINKDDVLQKMLP
jgi:cytochrome b561